MRSSVAAVSIDIIREQCLVWPNTSWRLNSLGADLEIARNGDLTLIDSRPPAVTSHEEVNLEGITYRR